MSNPSTPYTSSQSSRSSSISSMSSTGRAPMNLRQNSMDPITPWLVQKYGGTSVGKFARKIASEIVPEYLSQHKVAIVCSARSGSTKALGTTNLLLRAASEALQRPSALAGTPLSGTMTPSWAPLGRVSQPGSPTTESPSHGPSSAGSRPDSAFGFALPFAFGAPPAFSVTVDLIRSEHVSAARASVQDKHILRELETEIERDCEALRAFLFATQVIDEISPRSRDSIVGFGERLGCKIMAAVLRDQGVDAEYVSLENVVPPHGDSVADLDATLDQDFYDGVGRAVADRILQCGARVPVVTGFFGPIPGSLLRQVGRGYTDLLSALLAAALPAAELQIWKEVDGIFTADPRKVPTARLLPVISPEEASELTYYGSEVVHPFTMEQVIRKKIPIRIKNVENPSGGGTVIHPEPEVLAQIVDADQLLGDADGFLAAQSAADGDAGVTPPAGSPLRSRRPKLPTAVTIKERILVLNIHSNRKSVSHGFLAGIFGTLDRFGVVVDLISTSEVHVSMAIEGGGLGESGGIDRRVLERLVKDLRKIGTVDVHQDMAILSLVGTQMRNMVGIAGRMFSTLAQGNVNIEMISQGASEINISCVIQGRDAVKALNLIHQSCLQIMPEKMGAKGPWLF